MTGTQATQVGEIVQVTKAALKSTSVRQRFGGENWLLNGPGSIYGSDAGRDLIFTHSSALFQILKRKAEERKMKHELHLPRCGDEAREAIIKQLKVEFPGIEISNAGNSLTLSWEHLLL
ncbi:hypothetical protein FP2506_05846 [Fulvimarina pelagi HTCC2506]|uniref:Uncharacterized protein n=1 Tax=Fulvimarina pelagi HTCC2506 TaxID=314231 RepID=Q0G7M7_9HYPH|nr:hypothetical protein [Fulvimarina pelagi]EAU42337.1 hypothetical protein FP2506_05846 [Fulvimarina pelagi HTCC2506]